MEGTDFRAGEQLWLRGEPVIFVSYNRYSASRQTVAGIRPQGRRVRRSRRQRCQARPQSAESLARETSIPAS